jgi:hypothetical protein
LLFVRAASRFGGGERLRPWGYPQKCSPIGSHYPRAYLVGILTGMGPSAGAAEGRQEGFV